MRWRHHFSPCPGPVFLQGQRHAPDRARDSRSAVADQTVAGGIAMIVEIHVATGRGRRALPEIDKGRATVRKSHEHEAATTEIARVRFGHGQRKSYRNRRVHCIASVAKDCDSDLGRVPLCGDHDGVARMDGQRPESPRMRDEDRGSQ